MQFFFDIPLACTNFAAYFRYVMTIDHIFNSFYRPLCLYAMHYLQGDIDRAEDIVQDCFVKMWNYQKEHDCNDMNVKAFLYTAVYHACIDELRKHNPNIVSFDAADLDGIISDEEAKNRSVLEANLWNLIEELPDKCREIFLMSKRDGMKYREIAEELGISEKTVEHQISKALKKLNADKKNLRFVLSVMP